MHAQEEVPGFFIAELLRIQRVAIFLANNRSEVRQTLSGGPGREGRG